jgi:pSer/pThr/pTyr-binding forkhead associated (FHA) protein
VVTCEVCGTANEAKLTFCRNCGHRLKSQRSRGVAPTPATGMPRAKVRSESADDLNWEREEAPVAHHSRPSAPPLHFGKAAEEPLDAEPVPFVVEAVPADKVQCTQCGALSPLNYRFCISCGAVLKRASRAKPPPSAPAAPSRPEPSRPEPPPSRPRPPPPSRNRPPPPRSRPLAEPAIQDLEEIEDVAPLESECPRCGGGCRMGEVFCKHCGALLPKGKGALEPEPEPQPEPQPERAPVPLVRHDSGPPAAAVELTHKVAEGEPFPLADSAVKNRGAERVERMRAAARPEVTGKLVVIVEDGSEGRALELSGRQVDIGSAEGDVVLSEDRYLSQRHARFFRQEGQWYLRDLDSVNGVYRRLRKPAPLRDGDLVLLGLEVLEFDLVDHAERGLGHAIQHGVLVFGSPATTRRARLRQRTVEGVTRDVYHLVSDETTIGRETGDIVFTSDPFMSRRHAMITWEDEAQQYVISDLNSSNGTYLAIRDDVRLDNGDYIRLGQHLFRVDLPRAKVR